MDRRPTAVLTPPRRRDVSLSQVAGTLALGGALAMLVALRTEFLGLSIEAASWIALAVGVLAYAAVVRSGRGPWSAGAVFLLLVELFHLGLLVYVAFGMTFDPDLASYLQGWFYGPAAVEAAYLATLAIAAFGMTYALAVGRPEGRAAEVDNGWELERGKTFAAVGAVLVVGGVGLYLLYVLAVAPSLLFGAGRYGQYVDVVGGDRVLGLTTLAVMLGLILAAAAPACRARRVAIGAFVVFALLLLILGVRTAVLFPAAAGMVAAARRHRLPSGAKAAAVVLLGLVVISVVREARTLDRAEFDAAALNPLTAVAETGGTLRPVVETIEAGHDPRHGASYLIPLERLKDRATGDPDSTFDRDAPGLLMAARVPAYQIGYSAVAEAYFNFGTWGVPVVFGLLGAGLALLDRWRRPGIVPACVAGIAIAGLGLTVRNTFISLPATIIAGLVVLLVVNLLATSRAGRTARLSGARSPSTSPMRGRQPSR